MPEMECCISTANQIAKKKIEYYDKVLNDWEQEKKIIVRMQKETSPGDQKRKEELDNLLEKIDRLRKTIIKEKDEDNEIIEEIQNIIKKSFYTKKPQPLISQGLRNTI